MILAPREAITRQGTGEGSPVTRPTSPPTSRELGWAKADVDERFQLLTFCISRRLNVPGFDARFFLFPDRADRQKAADRLTEAVGLLRNHAPLRLSYLEKDLPKLSVSTAGAALAKCYDRIRLCLLDDEYVLADQTTPVDLALTLVHEGTHARLARAGYRYTDERRARIERVCYNAELVVARRIPGAERAVQSFERSIAANDTYYSRSVQRMREIRKAAKAMKELGWVARPVLWFTVALGWVLGIWRRRPPAP